LHLGKKARCMSCEERKGIAFEARAPKREREERSVGPNVKKQRTSELNDH